MDTGDYTGDPHRDAVAHVMDPAIASVASAVLRDADLGVGLDSILESVRAHEAVLEPFLASVNRIIEPVQAQLDELAATAAQGLLVLDSGIGLGVDLPDMMSSHALDDEWFSRIADAVGLTVDESVHRDLIDAVNQAFAAVEGAGLLDEPDAVPNQDSDVRAALDDVDLGELGEAGRAFVAREGRGLSWEAKKRLFAWYVGLTVLCTLLYAMVASEAAKEMIENLGTAAPFAVAAMVAAGQGWDRVMPRPEDPEDDTDTE